MAIIINCMKEITKRWLEFVDDDINTAKDLLCKTERVKVVTFHLQQAIEKTIKAYIQEKQTDDPPKTHDLVALIQVAELVIDPDVRKLLEELTYIYIESRYPTSLEELKQLLTKKKVQEFYNESVRFIEWIKNKF